MLHHPLIIIFTWFLLLFTVEQLHSFVYETPKVNKKNWVRFGENPARALARGDVLVSYRSLI